MNRPTETASMFFVLFSLCCLSSRADGGTWQIQTGTHTRAPVERAAIVDGSAVLASNGELYRVTAGAASVIARQPEPGAQLVLAPGGLQYAWVRARAGEDDARSLIDLVDTQSGTTASWQTDGTAGPAELHLGLDGKLILTRAPLDDPEGSRGAFRYTFWDGSGSARKSVDFDRALVILAADGTAVLLLGGDEARAYDAAGNELWRLAGRYRKAALSSAKGAALLNPADLRSIDRIVVRAGGETKNLQLPTPVHRLAIAPDGSTGAAAGDRGLYFFIDVAAGALRESGQAPSQEGVPYIFDLEVAGPDTLLLGILHRVEERGWPSASVAAVERDGDVTFLESVEIGEALSRVPDIDVRYGSAEFIAHTRELTFNGHIGGKP